MSPVTEPDGKALLRSIKRRLNWLVAATVVVYIVVVGLAAYGANTADSIHDGLCTFTADLQNRVTQSQDFLEKHPNGLGDKFPAAAIRAQIDNQIQTLNSLDSLDC